MINNRIHCPKCDHEAWIHSREDGCLTTCDCDLSCDDVYLTIRTKQVDGLLTAIRDILSIYSPHFTGGELFLVKGDSLCMENALQMIYRIAYKASCEYNKQINEER